MLDGEECAFMSEELLWRVEMHCHTCYSPDSLVAPEVLVDRCQALGLDKVLITDHNTIAGALRAQVYAPDFVVVGEEIRTSVGEFIAYYMQEEVPAGLSPEETLRRLEAQGAVIAIPHPLDRLRGGSALGLDGTLRYIDRVTALEVLNARCLRNADNKAARLLAQQRSKAMFAGSDAHSLAELGRATTLLPPFYDASTLRQALSRAQPIGRRSFPPFVKIASRWATLVKRSGLWHSCNRGNTP